MKAKIYFIALVVSFMITYFLVPLNIKLSKRSNLVDKPHKRGIHKKSIPLAGGLSFGISIIILQIIFYLYSRLLVPNLEIALNMLKLATGGILILILGFLDDKKKFTAKYKLLIQILIVSFMYLLGFKMTLLTNPFGMDIELGILSYPMTMLWFIIVINSFNLIDGLDGLASGVAAITMLVLFSVGLAYKNDFVASTTIIMFGAMVAFLKYNFFPARIFMGDTGSLFIGYNIAAISIAGTQQYKGITAITLLIPIIVLIIPLVDTILAIFRRMKRNVNIFEADKDHIHHKLLEIGFTQKSIALTSYFITFLFGLIALGFSFTSKKVLFVLLILISFILIVIVYLIFFKEKSK